MKYKITNIKLFHHPHVKFFNRLWVKALFINIIFLFFLLTLLFYFILSAQKKDIFKQLQKNTLNSAEFLASQLALSIYIWDKQNIEDKIKIFLSNLSETNSIAYVAIYSKKFKETLLLRNNTEDIRKNPQIIKYINEHSDEKKEYKTKDHLHIIHPVIYHSDFMKWSSLPDEMISLSPFDNTLKEGEIKEKEILSPVIGEIHLGITYKGVKDSLRKSHNYFIILSIPVFLFALIFHYFQSKLITRKLSLLSEVAKKISRSFPWCFSLREQQE